MSKLLIIGGSGFIGEHLIRRLKNTYDTTSLSRNSFVAGTNNLKLDLNITDFEFIKDFNKVIYLGTVSSPKEAENKPNEAFITNVVNIHKFLEAAKASRLTKIILLSSAVLYSVNNKKLLNEESQIDPFISIYNLSKYNLEILAQFYREKYNLPITVFRLSNTYGPGQSNKKIPYLIPGLITQAINKKSMEIWNTKPVRDWVYIDDMVEVLVKELEKTGGGLFNLGTGVGNSVGDVARIIADLAGVGFVDLGKEVAPPFKVICNITKLKTRLNYYPRTDLKQGLLETYNYFKGKINA